MRWQVTGSQVLASSLTFVLSSLARFPRMQGMVLSELQEEDPSFIFSVEGGEEEMEDLSLEEMDSLYTTLPHLQCVILEAFRRYPASPVAEFVACPNAELEGHVHQVTPPSLLLHPISLPSLSSFSLFLSLSSLSPHRLSYFFSLSLSLLVFVSSSPSPFFLADFTLLLTQPPVVL